ATPEQVDSISGKAGGSPLFAEELARLIATGKNADQAPTIEAAIQASLDMLDRRPLEALEYLSVLGQSCWDAALVEFGVEDVEPLMRKLVAEDVLVQQSSSRFPGTQEYTFKHALVRDVAYSSLSDSTRTKLHALAGHFLAKIDRKSTRLNSSHVKI